jgi:hypothetical protein
MKITEATTLAELHAYLVELGNPLVTMMKTHSGSRYTRHAIMHLGGVGSFVGNGDTEAEALEAVFAGLRKSLGITNLAYEPLNYVSKRPPQPCHGCMHEPADHPNDSGCQRWHAGPL